MAPLYDAAFKISKWNSGQEPREQKGASGDQVTLEFPEVGIDMFWKTDKEYAVDDEVVQIDKVRIFSHFQQERNGQETIHEMLLLKPQRDKNQCHEGKWNDAVVERFDMQEKKTEQYGHQ